MNKYRMVWQTSILEPNTNIMAILAFGLPWQYNYDPANDTMAIEYAKRIMVNDPGIRAGCIELLVWRVNPDEKLIARLTFYPPVVRNTLDSPS
jgi:hypothetical protein